MGFHIKQGQPTVLNCNEIWKSIPEYEDYYEVSNLGNVRSKPRDVVNTLSSTRHIPAKWLTARPNGTTPYLQVALSQKGKTQNARVHRLVATCFCEKPKSVHTLEVNHIDGNVLNNQSSNLEWITRSANLKHKFVLHPEYKTQHATRMVGTKFNAVSAYHNVSWDSGRNRWMASVKQNGKPLFQKRFKDEHEAAAYVNTMLDFYGITDRPRNIIT